MRQFTPELRQQEECDSLSPTAILKYTTYSLHQEKYRLPNPERELDKLLHPENKTKQKKNKKKRNYNDNVLIPVVDA